MVCLSSEISYNKILLIRKEETEGITESKIGRGIEKQSSQ